MKNIFPPMIRILFFFMAFPALSTPLAPVVVVTLKPIHSWVCTLMEGRGVPQLLLDGKLSPHTAALRPQEVMRAKQADLLIWIGPSFEAPLVKLMGSIPAEKKLTLEEHPEVDWLPQRHACDHGHGHSFIDGHIWLDPVRCEKIILLLAEKLSERDPLYRHLYDKNRERLKLNLKKVNEQLVKRLAPLKDKPFFVMHDAYQYFENRYGLSAAGVMLLSPEHPPSGKHLQRIQEQVRAQKKACIFREPQLQYSSMGSFLKKLGVREGVLDPLGSTLPEGSDFYENLMKQMAASFEACLAS